MDFKFSPFEVVCVPCVRVRALHIGVTKTVTEGTTALWSDYFWMHYFESSDSPQNWWNPKYYADASLHYIGSNNVSVGDTSPYLEVILTNGSTVQNIGQVGTGTFRTSMFNNKPEIYFSTRLSSDGDASRTGVIIKFNPLFCSSNTTRFPLPSDLYTISGTTVTWNTSHPLYNILYWKSLFEV